MKQITISVDLLKSIEALSIGESGRLLNAMIKYFLHDEATQLTGRESILWLAVKSQIDSQKADYAAMCEKNKKNRNSSKNRRVVTSGDESSIMREKEENEEKESVSPKRKEAKENIPFLKEKEDKEEKESIRAQDALPPELEKALSDFASFRKEIKKPLTDRARQLTINKVRKLYPDDTAKQVACIEQSIQCGYQGVFMLNEDKNKSKKQTAAPAVTYSDSGTQDELDRMNSLIQELQRK